MYDTSNSISISIVNIFDPVFFHQLSNELYWTISHLLSDDCIWKITSITKNHKIKTISGFYFKEDLNLINKGIISCEKIDIQVIITKTNYTQYLGIAEIPGIENIQKIFIKTINIPIQTPMWARIRGLLIPKHI